MNNYQSYLRLALFQQELMGCQSTNLLYFHHSLSINPLDFEECVLSKARKLVNENVIWLQKRKSVAISIIM